MHALGAKFLLDVAVILFAARLGGELFRRFRQPAVIGEIVAGIALGPTLLGALPGDPSGALFPADARVPLAGLGQIGLVVFMFLVGLEFKASEFRERGRAVLGISAASVALPFGLGVLLATGLYSSHHAASGRAGDFLPFALFLGVAMSITAFPVLARILVDRGLTDHPVGRLALSCAALQDALAWTLLAGVMALVASKGGWGYVSVAVWGLVLVVGLGGVARPLLRRLLASGERPGSSLPDPSLPAPLLLVASGIALSAWLADSAGLHPVFGAFAFGVVMPRTGESLALAVVRTRLEPVAAVLLPIYFVSAGMGVNVGPLGGSAPTEFALILLCACAGKIVGAAGAARASGVPPREALGIGALMNTRGLIEIIVLKIGLDAHLIDGNLYTLLVLMAIVTTLLAGPAVRVLLREAESAPALDLDRRAPLAEGAAAPAVAGDGR